MTITSALPRLFQLKFTLTGVIFAFAYAAFAQGAEPLTSTIVQTRPQVAESSLILNSAPWRNLTPAFPVMGLIAAAWATHHVRRRNARQLAATR